MAERLLDGCRVGLALATTSGGTGRHALAVVEAAASAGAAVVVAGPAATEASFGFSHAGAQFRPVEISAGLDPLRDLLAWRAARSALADCDVVHAHGLRAGLVAGFAVDRRTPFVVTWHNAVLRSGPAARVLALAERRVARRADVTLCVSADLADRVRALGGRDVRVAPVGSRLPVRSGRDPDVVRRALGLAAGEAMVLSIARLHPQKGLDCLIRASVHVAGPTRRPVRFLIAGDGPARAELAALVDALSAPVQLLGWREDSGDLLAVADLVVMPSRWEGSPLAAHEALLAGRPLVATSVGGLPELLGAGAARLVPPDDVGSLANAIGDLLDDDAERAALAERGSARGRDWPDADAAAADVVGVHAELWRRAR